ncbi:hypothetical protein QBC39DRAFT_360658 [Podospora conica]|nr:hypothetical protein QBC39DRAFT_360658 [Schizothecium conicum]
MPNTLKLYTNSNYMLAKCSYQSNKIMPRHIQYPNSSPCNDITNTVAYTASRARPTTAAHTPRADKPPSDNAPAHKPQVETSTAVSPGTDAATSPCAATAPWVAEMVRGVPDLAPEVVETSRGDAVSAPPPVVDKNAGTGTAPGDKQAVGMAPAHNVARRSPAVGSAAPPRADDDDPTRPLVGVARIVAVAVDIGVVAVAAHTVPSLPSPSRCPCTRSSSSVVCLRCASSWRPV